MYATVSTLFALSETARSLLWKFRLEAYPGYFIAAFSSAVGTKVKWDAHGDARSWPFAKGSTLGCLDARGKESIFAMERPFQSGKVVSLILDLRFWGEAGKPYIRAAGTTPNTSGLIPDGCVSVRIAAKGPSSLHLLAT